MRCKINGAIHSLNRWSYWILAGLLFTSAVKADWVIQTDRSSLHFVSTKNQLISEISQFKQLSGTVSEQGQFVIDIDLNSVNTLIPIRDQRMRKHLFSVDPLAIFKGKIDNTWLNMKEGTTETASIKGRLHLNGVDREYRLKVQVTKLRVDRIIVTSVKPVIVNAADFNLTQGIEELKLLARLNSIQMTVPVTFNLVLSKNQ